MDDQVTIARSSGRGSRHEAVEDGWAWWLTTAQGKAFGTNEATRVAAHTAFLAGFAAAERMIEHPPAP